MTIRVKVPLEFREERLNVARALKKKFPCDRQHLLSRIPITRWLPTYPLANLSYDFIAGLTVALTAIPQGIAYAVIAGLPPQYGLYAEVMPGLVYMLFGSCSYITIGRTEDSELKSPSQYLPLLVIQRSHSHHGADDPAVRASQS